MVERIIRFQTLIDTDRAVKRSGAWVRIHLAGRQTAPYWVEFFRASDAKRAAGSLIVHLREKVARNLIQTDSQYNRTISNWLDQLGGMGYIKRKDKPQDGNQKTAQASTPETETEKTGKAGKG